MRQPDNWGWRARIGMFIVGSEAVPEAEWWAMAPEGVSVHAARVTARAPWATWNEDRTAVTLADDVVRGARQFATMPLSSAVIGHSSSSLAGGAGWDEAVVEALTPLLAPGTRATTNGLDCRDALQALGVARPFLVFPAWFGDAMLEKGHDYFAAQGFAPSGHLRFDPGPGWRDMAPNELYPQGMGFQQDVEALYRQIRAACPAEADGVLIAGTGLRCVSIIEPLEQDLARPVITANQASLWQALRQASVQGRLEGYGQLLTM